MVVSIVTHLRSSLYVFCAPRGVEGTLRAGVLEQNTVDLMVETGLGDRLKREGLEHHGIELRFGGRGHRIAFDELTDGRAVTVYPRTRLECALVAGCDGSRTQTRKLDSRTVDPNGSFPPVSLRVVRHPGRAPPSSEELIYANHERGFALISTRTPEVQRHYLQVDPDDSVDNWSDDRIWDELHMRVDGEGAEIKDGRIFQKSILQFRSFVCEPMQHGNLFLAGDAAHTVPPTGAKGMNLAIADVYALAKAMDSFFTSSDRKMLDGYTETVLPRVADAALLVVDVVDAPSLARRQRFRASPSIGRVGHGHAFGRRTNADRRELHFAVRNQWSGCLDGVPVAIRSGDVSVGDDSTGQVVNFDAVAVDGFVSQ
ncbi:unnamed protein product, partial [Mesorhabditis spiculigera]